MPPDVIFFILSAVSFGLASIRKVRSPEIDFFPLGFCLLMIGVCVG